MSIGIAPPAHLLEPDPAEPAPDLALAGTRPASLWGDAWRRLRRNRAAVVGAAFLAWMSLTAAFAPWLPGMQDPTAQDLALGATPPSQAHWFGTDELGRDAYARVIYGGRISLLVGVVATLVSLLIGVTWGATAGYRGGRVDEFMMRIVDILYSLPYIFLVILLLVFFSRSLVMLFVALGLVQWLTMARIVRGQVPPQAADLRRAARALGADDARIIFRHIVPNTLGPVIVYTTPTRPAVFSRRRSFPPRLGVPASRRLVGTLKRRRAAVGAHPWLVIFRGGALAHAPCSTSWATACATR